MRPSFDNVYFNDPGSFPDSLEVDIDVHCDVLLSDSIVTVGLGYWKKAIYPLPIADF